MKTISFFTGSKLKMCIFCSKDKWGEIRHIWRLPLDITQITMRIYRTFSTNNNVLHHLLTRLHSSPHTAPR